MHCGDDFAMYTCVELLCCTPESNIMLCVNYVSKKKKLETYIGLFHYFLYKNMVMLYIHLFFLHILLNSLHQVALIHHF